MEVRNRSNRVSLPKESDPNNSPKLNILPIWQGWFYYLVKKKTGIFETELWPKTWFETDKEAHCITWFRNPELDDPRNTILGSIDLLGALFKEEDAKKKPFYRVRIKDRKGRSFHFGFDSNFDRTRYVESYQNLSAFEMHPMKERIDQFEQEIKQQNLESHLLTHYEDDDEYSDFWSVKLEVAGSQGKEVSFHSLIQNPGTVVILLRHCLKSKIELSKCNLIVIGNGSAEQALWFQKHSGYTDPIYLDQKKRLYRGLLCRNNLLYYFSPETFSQVEKATEQGYSLIPLSQKPGDPLQLGGIFAFSPMGIFWRFNERHVGDEPEYAELLTACQKHHQKFLRATDLINYEDLTDKNQILKTSSILTLSPDKKWTSCGVMLSLHGLYIFEFSKKKKSVFFRGSGSLPNEPMEKPSHQINIKDSEILKIDRKYLESKNLPIPKSDLFQWGFAVIYKKNLFAFYFDSEIEYENWLDFSTFVASGESTVFSPEIMKIEEELRNNSLYIRPCDLNFEKAEIIGSGASGAVCKVLWHESVDTAVKFLRNLSSIDEVTSFYNEVKLLSSVRHPNVVSMYGISRNMGSICLVTEYISNGNLDKALRSPQDYPITNLIKTKILKSNAAALVFLHSRGIIHRDVKPSNILIVDWEQGQTKLCDFGISSKPRKGVDTEQKHVGLGSPAYSAPEVFYTDANQTNKIDVFSFAILAYELDTGNEVWPDIVFSFKITERYEQGMRPDLNPNSIFKCLIEKCWQQDPSSRPAFSEIMKMILKLEQTQNTWKNLKSQSHSRSFASLGSRRN